MRWAQVKAYSFRNALLVYVTLFLALTFHYWLLGEVVAPYRQAAEIAAPETSGALQIENKKFSDYANSYIPEITGLLNGQRAGWLTLWTERNELGRPLYHISGFSPAYPPAMLIAAVIDSPQRFITLLSLGTCFLAGFFVLMLCRELRLSPLAGLLTAGGLAASPLFMYWLSFPVFPAVWCWSAGALYGVTRLVRKTDLLGWSVLVFSAYSLLMTAYPQPVVFHAYILTGYAAYLAYRRWQTTGWLFTARCLAVVASAVVVGGTLALPAYADLAHIAIESARAAPDPSFFATFLPTLDSPTTVVRFLTLSTFPEIFGNPISPLYPLSYDGLSVTPLVIFFALAGLLLRLRSTWGWWLPIVTLCALAFIHPLYLFGVKYLGFNLSPSTPLGSIALPLTIIAAYGADALIQRLQVREHSWAVMLAAVGTGFGLLIALSFGLTQGLMINWDAVVMTLAVVGLLAAQFDRTRPALLGAALVTVGTYISFPLMLRQEPSQIVSTSPLVEKVRDNLPPDSRYAVVSPGLVVLPPNLNASLGLASVHSYNSLSSRRYHTLIKSLGGEVQTYGRWNSSILPDYSSAMFWVSNISLILSPKRLEHGNLEYLGQTGDIHLHRVVSRMGCCLQVTPPNSMVPGDVQVMDPRSLVTHQPAKTVDQGDLLEFEVQGSQASLLILSQKFHRDWHAQVLTSSGWADVKTVMVNGVFQGVLLPTGAQKAKLQFLPFVRFAWIAHIFWLLVLVVLVFQALRSRVSPPRANEEVPAK